MNTEQSLRYAFGRGSWRGILPGSAATRKRKTKRALGAGVYFFALAWTGLSAAQPREHEQLFDLGVQAQDQGHAEEARRYYAEAWKLGRSPLLAANLGLAEFELGEIALAAEHLSYAIYGLGRGKQKEELTLIFQEVRKKVAGVLLGGTPEGADLSVDGVTIGSVPLEGPLYVSPGRHVLQLSKPGFHPMRREVIAVEGGTNEVVLHLVPLPSASPVVAPKAAPNIESRTSWLTPQTVTIMTGATLTATGLALGTAFRVMGDHNLRESQRLRDALPQLAGENYCPQSGDSVCSTIDDQATLGLQRHAISTASFVASGAMALATGLIAVLWRNPSPSKVQVAVLPNRDGASLFLQFGTLGGSPGGLVRPATEELWPRAR